MRRLGLVEYDFLEGRPRLLFLIEELLDFLDTVFFLHDEHDFGLRVLVLLDFIFNRLNLSRLLYYYLYFQLTTYMNLSLI